MLPGTTPIKRLLAALLLTSGIATAQEPPGELIDIGGHSLHLYCLGENSGPTVILDAGLGDWSLQMRNLQLDIAEFTRVCSYDRAGYGWSEPGPEPRTSEQLVSELVTLLNASAEQAPFYLVAHSFAGVNAIALAHDHPELVAGLVLIDSSHPQQIERLSEVPALLLLQDLEIEGLWQLATAAAAGEVDPESIMAMVPAGVPEELHDLWADQFLHSGSLPAAVAEYDVISDSMAWTGERYSPTDLPLAVIARDEGVSLPPEMLDALGIDQADLDKAEEIWREMQREHAELSVDSRFEIAAGSPHYVHYFQPELVLELLRGMMAGTP